MSRGAFLTVALPPMAGLLFVAAFLGAEALGANPFSHVQATVAEAAATGSAARVLELIRSGRDPNQTSTIPAGVLDSSAYDVNAIDAAILGRRPELIPVLTSHGAVVGDAARTACLAHAVDLPEALPMVGLADGAFVHDSSIDSSDAIHACIAHLSSR